MAIKIEFDSSHNVLSPTLVLATRNGDKLGGIIYHNLIAKDAIRNSMEMSFSVYKNDYSQKNGNANLWSSITDFKLVWVKEWNIYFEITVNVDEEDSTIKEITATSLGDAELSQINLYDTEINTENDIAREDYEPTVLYNEDNPKASLLHRITEKAPHYVIAHVDSSLCNIQRTFTFDNKNILDALQEIAEEIECVFEVVCKSGSNNNMQRKIYVYDLKTYGEDTNILLTTDALANNIHYSVDTGSVKNCFKLEGGDDLMTATIRNCNPNGSGYIWYISDELTSDMSEELVSCLQAYNFFYDYYQNTYDPLDPITETLPEEDAEKVVSQIIDHTVLINKYNNLVDKYSTYSTDYKKIVSPIKGYPEIMEIYYNIIDFYYYLNDSFMPDVSMSDTDAETEAEKLNYQSLANTAVQNLSSTTSVATVSAAILSMAKAIVDTRYQVKTLDDECSFDYVEGGTSTWSGKIKVTNYSDEEDTYTTTLSLIPISSDYSTFVQQKLKVALANTRENTISDIEDLFELEDSQQSDTPFKSELKKYSLQRLLAFHDACQGCIDILIQQGIADHNNTESSMYTNIYLPYYTKLGSIQLEMDVRQAELDTIAGKFDSEGGLLDDGMQTILEKERDNIQSNLDFEEYLGSNLWQEFVAYRREDTYSNDNYISDGLGNDELFARAMEFIETAKEDIEKSATKQHTIDATLRNLLVMKEFTPIIDSFAVGNWLRIKFDNKLFKLRLVDYQIDFENLENLDVTFTDIMEDNNEVKNILNQASSMATSYNAVSRQARRGDKSSVMVEDWVNDGLALTTTKIVDKADNQEVSWDKHGLVCREYDDFTDTYSDTQVKLINKGVYITDNNWRTAKAGIGNFTFFNPAASGGEGAYQEAYGVIADTLVGNLILGKSVGIYNTKNSLTMDEDGFILITDGTGSSDPQSVFTIRRKTINNGVKSFKDMFYIDSNGYVTINGGVKIEIDGTGGSSTLLQVMDNKITTHITDELDNGGLIESSISQSAAEIKSTVSAAVSKWDLSGVTHSIDLYGYGHPQTDNGLDPQDYPNAYFLDQTNGYIYYAVNGTIWAKTVETLSLITSNLSSSITQTATNILSTVSATYETKSDANVKKTALESSIEQTATSIKSTVAEATSKYDETGYTISIRDYGIPNTTTYPPTSYTNQLYLNQEDGAVYKSNGTAWNRHKDGNNQNITLPLITANLQSQITQNATAITSKVSTGDFGTLITQNVSNVQIAWNNISKYISFEDAAINIYDNLSQGISHLLMKLDNSGLAYYEFDSSHSSAIVITQDPQNIYQPKDYVDAYVQNGTSGQYWWSDGVNWNKVEAVGSRFLMKTNRDGAYYYRDGERLGKIGTNTLGADHANHPVRGLVFDLDAYGDYMTWAARTDVGTNYIIKLTYFQKDMTMMSGTTFKEGFRFSAPAYFRQSVVFDNSVEFNNTTAFNDPVSFNDNIATDVQMNGNKLYLNSTAYIGVGTGASSGVLNIVGQSDKALTLTGYNGYNTIIGAGGVTMNTDLTVSGTITSGSDVRLKTNIKESQTDVLPLICDIELKEFDWLTDQSHTNVGIIAQQLKNVLPELVQENSETGMQSIKVDRFIPYLVKAIQELYDVCGGKKSKGKTQWTDKTSISEKEEFVASITNNEVERQEWVRPHKPSKETVREEDLILLDK